MFTSATVLSGPLEKTRERAAVTIWQGCTIKKRDLAALLFSKGAAKVRFGIHDAYFQSVEREDGSGHNFNIRISFNDHGTWKSHVVFVKVVE